MNHLMKIVTSLLAPLLLVSFSAQGADRYILGMGNAHYRGQNIIRLKQEIRNQYGQVGLRRARIVRVHLIAKSRFGNGSAALYVGGRDQDRKRVLGRPATFNSHRASSFDRVVLNSFRNRFNQSWQLHLRGNIKVRRIIVTVRHFGPRRPGTFGLSYYSVGSAKAPKFVWDTKTFYVNRGRVFRLILNVTKSSVRFGEVLVQYRNGQVERFYELQRIGYRGYRLRAWVGGRRIHSIRITSTSPNTFGSRGRYNVFVGVRR